MAAAEEAWLRVRAVFDAAVDLAPAARRAFVVAQCGGDAALADEVLTLLAAHEQEGEFLPLAPDAAAPERIGPFRIERLLGRGGMGAVYAATQDAPHRTVALKVLHQTLPTPAEVARFLREADALARLRHPGIAAVFAAGTASAGVGELAWIAMELVPGGVPLTTYAAERGLDRRARVALLVQACAAVEHAHRAGIVHRDLKPGNLLVGSDGTVRVIDFGIARFADPQAAAAEPLTAPGALLGTLAYMSPEQAAGQSTAIDARSDVHALGVILYELLLGRLPFATAGLALADALRRLSESQPAAAPELDADLRAVLWQAMAREPRDRYASAAALGADLQRWLDHELVLARPPRWRDLLRIVWQRHRGRVVAAAIAVVALLAAVLVSGVFAVQAQRRAAEAEAARRTAAAESRAAAQALAVLTQSVGAANPFRKVDMTLEQLLERIAAGLAGGDYEPSVQSRLHQALAASYRGLGRFELARQHATLGSAALPAAGTEVAALRAELAMIQGIACAELREFEPAVQALEAALAGFEQLAAAGDARRVGVCARLAAVHLLRGSADEAERLLHRALREAEAAGAASPEAAEALANLGNLEWQRGREAQAAALWQRALEGFRTTLWDEHPLAVQVRSNLGLHLQNEGQLAAAEELFVAARERFGRLRGADSPDVANAELKLAYLHVEQGRGAEAIAAAERALAIRRAKFGADASEVPAALQALAYAKLHAADGAGAAAAAREALELRLAKLPPEHPEVAGAQLLLGRSLVAAGDAAAAEPLLRTAVATRRRVFGAEHWRTATAESALGECLLVAGDTVAAGELLRGALPRVEAGFPAHHPERQAAARRVQQWQAKTAAPGSDR